MAGARRYVWNWDLQWRQEHFKATGKTLFVTAGGTLWSIRVQVPGRGRGDLPASP
jgi:hypothetical protein